MQEGDVRTAIELLNGAARARRRLGLLRRRPRRHRLPPRRLPLQALEHRAPRSRSSTRRSSSRSARELPCDGLRSDIFHWRSRCHRRQRDFEAAREDVERALELAQGLDDRAHDGERLLPGLARRRAHRPLAALAQLRRAGEEALPGARRRAERRPAADQPRRAQPAARQAAGGDRAPQGVVRGRGRGRLAGATPPRRWAASRRCTCTSASGTRPTSTRAMRCGCSKGAKTSSTRSASHSSCSAARCSSADRLDEAEDVLPRGGRHLRAALLDQPPRRRLGRARRPRRAPRPGRGGSTALPERRRSPAGHPVLRKERRRHMKTRLMFIVLSASVFVASWGGWLFNPDTWSDGVLASARG